jgi:hypothetical protein
MSVAEVGMVHGTVPFVWMTLMPGSGAGVVPARLSLVPLRDLFEMGWLGIVGNGAVPAALASRPWWRTRPIEAVRSAGASAGPR